MLTNININFGCWCCFDCGKCCLLPHQGGFGPGEGPKRGKGFIITTLSEYGAKMYMSGWKVLSKNANYCLLVMSISLNTLNRRGSPADKKSVITEV